ncbi:PREDICTED: venom allergen 5-like [Dinoponera quadriceps]|uniref:Venom allergen 5-like n=1 Tax=Dinoponera quadriceps TaxID=609295 RepID=A0A6P3Y2E4_DINQU|nr:PREDICTED: venom allergen 5-like [Dinoponera quadriceps]
MMSVERDVSLVLMAVACLLVEHCAPSCLGKSVLRSGSISCEEKQIILNEHNRLRQLVALGQIHGQPSAANMMEMIWDDELAAIAQRWADRCAESHDSLRNVRRFAVGQNIARTWTTRPPGLYDGEPNWRRQISSWFNEVQYYHTGYSKATGHYTQLVWGDTFLLGCGYSFYYDPARGYTKNYVCNYGPSGNVLGYQPYKSGQPACGSYGMSYSNRYAGLCSRGSYYHLGALCVYG